MRRMHNNALIINNIAIITVYRKHLRYIEVNNQCRNNRI